MDMPKPMSETKSGRRTARRWALNTALAGLLGGAVSVSAANPTVEQLRELSGSWDPDLTVALEGGSTRVTIGDPVRYRLDAGQAGVCYLLHVDAAGASALMRPSDCSAVASRGSYFPASGNLVAAEPLGREAVFAVLLREPSATAEAMLSGSPGYVSIGDPAALDRLLAEFRQAATAGKLAVAETSYEVRLASADAGDEGLQYTTRGIIRKVVEGTEEKNDLEETVSEISFDVQSINFEFGSDKLTPQGTRQLDEFGAALASPELRNLRLRVAGHTDDQGEPSYNMDLSERRAATVARYLEENFLISIDRLEIIGMGEETPLVNETTLEARRLNRRVEMVFLTQ
jgi:outer membrane protein OmpA-like peptidoglycan-associated protein